MTLLNTVRYDISACNVQSVELIKQIAEVISAFTSEPDINKALKHPRHHAPLSKS